MIRVNWVVIGFRNFRIIMLFVSSGKILVVVCGYSDEMVCIRFMLILVMGKVFSVSRLVWC